MKIYNMLLLGVILIIMKIMEIIDQNLRIIISNAKYYM